MSFYKTKDRQQRIQDSDIGMTDWSLVWREPFAQTKLYRGVYMQGLALCKKKL